MATGAALSSTHPSSSSSRVIGDWTGRVPDSAEVPIPASFLCPISREIMRDPVATVDGYTYERRPIQEWFHLGHQTSPMTGLVLRQLTLAPEVSLRRAIQEYETMRPQLQRIAVERCNLAKALEDLAATEARAKDYEEDLRHKLGLLGEGLAEALKNLRLIIDEVSSSLVTRAGAGEASSFTEMHVAMLTEVADSLAFNMEIAYSAAMLKNGAPSTVPSNESLPPMEGSCVSEEDLQPVEWTWVRTVDTTDEGESDSVNSLVALGSGLLASVASGEDVKIWDPELGSLVATLLGNVEVEVLCLTALGNTDRLASGSEDGTITVWNANGAEVVVVLEGHSDAVSALAALGAESLASGSWDETIKIWSLPEGRCVNTLEGNQGLVVCLAALSGQRLASGSLELEVKIWDVSQATCVASLQGHAHGVGSLAALGDDRLASGSADTTVRIWDLSDQRCVATLEGHDDWVSSLTALGSNRLASSSADWTIRIWDLHRGLCLATLSGHSDAVFSLIATAAERLISGSGDGNINIWEEQPVQALPA